MMQFEDRMTLDAKPRITSDGYMVATAKVARSGIQEYLPAEMGKQGTKPLRLYRPADEVFSEAALRSFAHRPVTNDHPARDVNASNWARLAKGYTGDQVARDGDYIRVPLTLMDAGTVKAQQSGKRELSAGYTADIDWTAGVTDAGEPYDGTMRNIRANHIALVQAGRAGHEARIGDALFGAVTVTDADLAKLLGDGGTPVNPINPNHGGHQMADTKQVVVDGLTIDTTPQGAEAIAKLQKQVADAEAGTKALADAHDKELAKRDAEIAELKEQVMDAAALDKAIVERADLIAKAREVADVDYSGKAAADIRKAAVRAKLGDKAIDGKSDAYIEARFDVLCESVKDGAPASAAHIVGDAHALADAAHAAYIARIYNGGRTAKES